MALIDAEYYSDVFGGTPAADDRELSVAIRRAELLIETVIGRSVLGEFSPFQSRQLRRAVALQAEHLLVNGISPADGRAYSLGEYRESVGSGARTPGLIAPAALACLNAAGLLYRGLRG